MTSTSEIELPSVAGQALAGLGAALVLIGVLSTAVMAVGAALMVIGVVASAPYARRPGPLLAEWWSPMAVGALVAVVGFGIAFALESLGEVAAVIGAVTTLTAAVLGSPPRPTP